ncbi:pentatricopeptide repeat-containing protein At4g21880, mitochondrial [Rosa chinensis]|uniref:pentatricopeptide repeat-containing protein At4g21880, mitochondrial n=1 Tax=Rosa chinensis TaxID=74649 RepID=UPI000D08EEA9|nr:pentatricopeptide repeat-containing protein At4g21880, mitochondrial [Rosa chinensis]
MKAKKLSSLFRSAIKYKPSSSSSSAKSLPSPAEDATLKFVSASEDSTRQLPGDIYSILCGGTYPDIQEIDDAESLERELDLPWFPDLSHSAMPLRRKEVSRERKQRFAFGNTQGIRFDKLVDMCANRLGTETTIQVFDKLGRETGVKECNALIKRCIEGARIAPDEVVGEKHMQLAFEIFKSMKEQGFPLEEETYGPFLEYLIDMGMTKEFCFFCRVIKDDNPLSVSRLGYYEMMLWIRVNDEKKIQELCNDIESYDGVNKSILQENYLLALCESDRTKEILKLLESMDITKFSSPDFVARIFKCLGRLLLESFAEKVLLEFKASDCAAGNTSNLIYSYVVGIPNLAVEDVISKFKNLHTKLEVTPSSVSYEKLIIYCCDSLKVHVALELVDEMSEQGLTFSMEALHSILQASSESCDFNLVHQIYSVISRGNLKPNSETFRSMINLCVKMKDYEGAYSMLSDLKKMNLTPTAAMYNAIMAGYFREKNLSGGLKVLKQMKEADVKPDSHTFSHLITNCNSEEDINMYYEEMKRSGIQVTKQVFMALVNAYAACGQFEKAKQVLLDKGIPVKSFNEIKSVLVQALASHGQLSDAFNTYEEIKQAGCSLEPKAVISLIEHLQSDEEALSRLLLLLETLTDPNYWLDGCLRTILYCVRYKHLRPAVNLLEQLRDQVCTDELALEVIFDKVFSFIAESESTSLEFGLDLLHAMKSELGLTPSRKCLDFLLHACVTAKDLQSSLFIWQEYQAAGLPYNTLSFLRMYQALLAAGDRKAAKVLGRKIPKDDPHVRSIIESCTLTYLEKKEEKKKKKKKK